MWHYVESLVLPISRRSSDGSILFTPHCDPCSPCFSEGGPCLHRAWYDHRDRVRYFSSPSPGYPCLKAVLWCSVYGITILQAYIYFRRNNASARMRCFVSTILCLEQCMLMRRLNRSHLSCKWPVHPKFGIVYDHSQRPRHCYDDPGP